MQRIRVLGPVLLAALALTATGAGAASAAGPIWYTCAKAPKNEAGQYTGHYETKACKSAEYKASGGKYELRAGVGKGKKFKTSSGTVLFHTINPESGADVPIECASLKGEGYAAPPNLLVKVKIAFSKCHVLKGPCGNVKQETLETKTLSGQLGWIDQAAGVVGIDLASEAEPGGPMAEFFCEALGQLRIRGSIIGRAQGDVEAVTNASVLSYAPGRLIGKVVWNESGETYEPIVNIPRFEGGPIDIQRAEIKGSLTGHPQEFYPAGGLPSGLEATAVSKGEALGIYPEGSQ